MDFIYKEDRIYCKNEIGSVIAEITFPLVSNGVIELERTFVDSALRGEGIADKLVKEVVEIAKAKNKKIKPTCSYAAIWFKKHPEYTQLIFEE